MIIQQKRIKVQPMMLRWAGGKKKGRGRGNSLREFCLITSALHFYFYLFYFFVVVVVVV